MICGSRGAGGIGSGLGKRAISIGGGVCEGLAGIAIFDCAGDEVCDFGTFRKNGSFSCLENNFIVTVRLGVHFHAHKQIAQSIN
jgi:hypothetical protein